MRINRIYHILVLSLLLCPLWTTGQNFQRVIDSLKLEYSQLNESKTQVDLLNAIAYNFRRIASSDSVLYYAQLAKDKADKIDYLAGLAVAHKNIGIAHFKAESPPDTAIFYYQKASELAAQAKDYYTQAACLNNIALIEMVETKYDNSIQRLLKGLDIYQNEIKEDNQLRCLILANLGTAYSYKKDNLKAIEYYERALAMAHKLDEKIIISIFTNNLAKAKFEEGQLSEGVDAIIQVLPLIEELGDLESKAESLKTLSDLYVAQGTFSAAMEVGQQALAIAEENEFGRLKYESLMALAKATYGQEKWDLAISYSQKAAEGAEEIKNYHLASSAWEVLAQANEKIGQYKTAYYALQKHDEATHRNADDRNKEITANLEAKYQSQEQENQILNLQNAQKGQREKFILLLIAAGLIFLSLIITLRSYYQKVKTTKALNNRNEQLAEAEQILNEKNQQLQEYIESNMQLENFAYLASHDLREPMRTIISFSQLLEKSAIKKFDATEKEYLAFVQNGIRRIESLVNDLLTYSRVNNRPLKKELINPQELIQEIKGDLLQSIEDKQASIIIKKSPEFIIADRLKIYQLLQNLISNAIKYHRDGEPPKVIISAKEKGKLYKFSVQDNGIGIAKQYHQQIFLLFKTLESKSISGSSGIGLATCKKIAEQHGGKIWLESEPGKGSTFYFTIAKDTTDSKDYVETPIKVSPPLTSV